MLFLGLVIADRRAKAMEDSANAQAKANENVERGQRQERLKNAIEHLGHDSVSIRLGGAYELFHLAQDTKELRQTILDILCAHIRQTTSDKKYQEDPEYKPKPSEEIQSLLTLLFVQDHNVFKGLHINLQGSWLNGANLAYARLRGARLDRSHLQDSKLDKAELQGAVLSETWLQMATFYGTKLQGAVLFFAQLQGAELTDARLHGATGQPSFLSSFEERIKERVGMESDFTNVIFEGDLTHNDIESFVENLPEDTANEWRGKLTPHVGKERNHEIPANSGAFKGSYTNEEAEEWIAEYKEAMAETRKKDDS